MKNKDLKSNVNYLELTPVRNYEHVLEDNGNVSVLVPKFTQKYLVKILTPILKKPYFKACLDEFGTNVWLEMDGDKKVSDISSHLENKYGDKVYPAIERTTKFMTDLYRYNFIKFKEII